MSLLPLFGVPAAVRENVYTTARACIVKAIEDGKSGRGLRFCGDDLMMTCPRDIEPCTYPTPGVWHEGSYMGDDGC